MDHGALARIPVDRFVITRAVLQAYAFNPLKYSFEIHVAPLNTGLPWPHQPEEPQFQLDAFHFPYKDWRELSGRSFSYVGQEIGNSSVYVGDTHNPVDVHSVVFGPRNGRFFPVEFEMLCDFEFEGVGQNTNLEFATEVEFVGLYLVNNSLRRNTPGFVTTIEQAIERAAPQVDLSAYQLPPHMSDIYIRFDPS